jgi:hypothetical protein
MPRDFIEDSSVNYEAAALRSGLDEIASNLGNLSKRNEDQMTEALVRLNHTEQRLDRLLQSLHQPPMRRIAYLHIPKSGGTTLANAIIDAIGPRHPVGGSDRFAFGSFDDFLAFPKEDRQYIYLRPEHISPFADFLGGHFTLSTILTWDSDAAILMVMREPQSRLLSHWTFWRTGYEDIARAPESWQAYLKLAYRSFHEFLTAPKLAAHTDNVVARMLLWPHKLIPTEGFIPPRHDKEILEIARDRLKRIGHINILENDDLHTDIGRWLGRPIAPKRMKITPPTRTLHTDLQHQLNPQTLKAWAARSRIDKILWREAAGTIVQASALAAFEAETIQQNMHRHAQLLAGSTPAPK